MPPSGNAKASSTAVPSAATASSRPARLRSATRMRDRGAGQEQGRHRARKRGQRSRRRCRAASSRAGPRTPRRARSRRRARTSGARVKRLIDAPAANQITPNRARSPQRRWAMAPNSSAAAITVASDADLARTDQPSQGGEEEAVAGGVVPAEPEVVPGRQALVLEQPRAEHLGGVVGAGGLEDQIEDPKAAATSAGLGVAPEPEAVGGGVRHVPPTRRARFKPSPRAARTTMPQGACGPAGPPPAPRGRRPSSRSLRRARSGWRSRSRRRGRRGDRRTRRSG